MEDLFEFLVQGVLVDGISLLDDYLSAEEVSALVEALRLRQERQEFRHAAIGSKQHEQRDQGIRGDFIHWIEEEDALPAELKYLEKADALRSYLNRTCYLGLNAFECHYAMYPKGAFYKRHRDQFQQDDRRRLSIVTYLNQDWLPSHGGHLKVYLPGGPRRIRPLAGRLVCFESHKVEHEVLPANRERLSLTGWMLTSRYSFV